MPGRESGARHAHRRGRLFGPAVAAAALLGLAAASSALAVAIPHANGHDYVLPDGNVYQLGSDGCYRHVPNLATAKAMGIDWNTLAQVNGVSPVGAPIGAPIPSLTTANGKDYLLPNGDVYQFGPHCQYHLIPDVATANKMGLEWEKLLHATTVAPIGAPVPSVVAKPKVVCKAKASVAANGHDYLLPKGNVYQRGADGRYHLIPDAATGNAMGLKWNTLLRASSVGPIGAPIGSICSST